MGNTLEYKIVNEGSDAIIGSNSKNSAGDVYDTEQSFAIGNSLTRRKKRMADMAVGVLLVLFFPFFLLKKNGKRALANVVHIWSGNKTWIGYCGSSSDFANLPQLKAPVFTIDEVKGSEATTRAKELNRFFAASYTVGADIAMLLRHVTK